MPDVIAFFGYDPARTPHLARNYRPTGAALGLTQRELGRQLCMHRSTFGKVEIGREQASEAMLKRMREFLGALLTEADPLRH
jgi:transcriptional regulator with XRE-family HTH domain